MAWGTSSKMFAAAFTDLLGRNTVALDLNTDTFKAALYSDSITAPDQLVTAANSAYGSGVWTGGSGANLRDTTAGNAGWPYAGIALTSVTLSDYSTASVKWDAADTPSADAHTTIASAIGVLVYDDTATSPADQGVSFHYLGGAQSVTEGTLTLVWNASGIISVAI